jgi:hypothetical protein
MIAKATGLFPRHHSEGLAEVGASFEQMSSKAVTQSMGGDVLVLETGALRRVAGI